MYRAYPGRWRWNKWITIQHTEIAYKKKGKRTSCNVIYINVLLIHLRYINTELVCFRIKFNKELKQRARIKRPLYNVVFPLFRATLVNPLPEPIIKN
jgi:hypothetical protein